MSTAVAPPAVTPLPPSSVDRDESPTPYSTPSAAATSRLLNLSTAAASHTAAGHAQGLASNERSPAGSADGKSSPKTYVIRDSSPGRRGSKVDLESRSRGGGGHPPKIIVKKEPVASPELATSRHRPQKLDLSKGNAMPANGPMTTRTSGNPLTAARESAGMGMHDVGLACLSPGFSTHDPTMREQLQRSISVRDQQRHIIESRLQRSAKPGDGDGGKPGEAGSLGGLKTASARRRPPPGLSIVAPPHEQFANERVIMSAPLHPSFPGRHQCEPLTRHVTNQPSNLSNTSHIHHVPAAPTDIRLPPITDVFATEGLGAHREPARNGGYFPPHTNSNPNSSHSTSRPTLPSPGQPSTQPPPSSAGRPRDFRSAEEAVASMSGGREELLPKIIHYGGHQPPTPPSPLTGNGLTPHKPAHAYPGGDLHRTPGGAGAAAGVGGGRRRGRREYEGDSPPLANGPEIRRGGPFGEGRDSPGTQRKKKDEFLTLCSRAWDLFHS